MISTPFDAPPIDGPLKTRCARKAECELYFVRREDRSPCVERERSGVCTPDALQFNFLKDAVSILEPNAKRRLFHVERSNCITNFLQNNQDESIAVRIRCRPTDIGGLNSAAQCQSLAVEGFILLDIGPLHESEDVILL